MQEELYEGFHFEPKQREEVQEAKEEGHAPYVDQPVRSKAYAAYQKHHEAAEALRKRKRKEKAPDRPQPTQSLEEMLDEAGLREEAGSQPEPDTFSDEPPSPKRARTDEQSPPTVEGIGSMSSETMRLFEVHNDSPTSRRQTPERAQPQEEEKVVPPVVPSPQK